MRLRPGSGDASARSARTTVRRALLAGAASCLLTLAASTARAAVDDYLGKPIQSVNLLIEGR
jgi:hypothetical protein